MKNNNNYDLIIKTKIWETDNYELVDYDNPYFTKKSLKVNSSGVLCRKENEIFLSKQKGQENALLKIKKNDNNYSYKIDCGKFSKDLNSLSNEDAAFMVFKSDFFKDPKTIKDRFYKLNQGDIIKVGRVYLKLLDYEIYEEESTDKNKDTSSNNNEDKKSLIRNFSQNSSIIKGQEVIKGTFINDDNRLRINADLINKNSIDNNCILSNRNRSNNSNILNINFKTKNSFYLPRINSSEELLVIKHKRNQNPKKENSKKIIINHHKIKKLQKNRVCRICYGEDSSIDNPLIYPCICKGSMKYIHYLCLKNWLNSKVESMEQYSEDNPIISYNTKEICCELCKTQFPDYIRYKEKLYNITFYKPNFKEFLVFESLRNDRNSNNKSRYINIVSFDNRKFINIGRSNKCDFSIPEISLSRFHSLIYKIKGELYIEDNKSKFGTLILIQNNNIEINNYMPLKLQIARTYIKIKKDLPLFYSCCNSEIIDDQKFDYQEQNQKHLNVFSYFKIKDNKDNLYESESSEGEKDNNINKINSNKNDDEKSEKESSSNNGSDETGHGPQLINIIEKSSSNNKKEKSTDKEDKIIDINNAKEDIKDNKNISNIEIINNNIDKINLNQNNKNENSNNDINIYNNKNNIENIIKTPSFNNINLNNNSRTSLEDLSNDTFTIKIKKNNNINLIIEDNNNKYLINSNDNSNNNVTTKTMKKIKILNSSKNKDEFALPVINDLNKINKKNIEPLENLINMNQLNQTKGISTLSHQDTNLNTNTYNIFNISKNQPKITINKKNFYFFNSNQIVVNNNNVSFLKQILSDQKEKEKGKDDEKEDKKEQ